MNTDKKTLVSIVIPTLNEESVIKQTLTQFKSGFTLPHEIIVSDGKSKDRTVELARAIADKVVVHNEERRQTIAEGRNVGARAASGEFLAFIDADCTVRDPDAFFGRLLEHFKRDRSLVAANVCIRVLPQYETFADKIIFGTFNLYIRFINNFFHFGISAGEFQMIRRSAFEKIGGYDEKLVAAEDVDLFQRLRKVGKVRCESSLTIYHTGRRAHKMGWPKLLWLWVLNPLMMMIVGRAESKEWEPIR